MTAGIEDKIFAEISIRGIKGGNVFAPISTDVANLTAEQYDYMTKAVVEALYKVGIDAREQLRKK